MSTMTVALTNIMTPQYAAPEMLTEDVKVGIQSDIYSFAIVM